MFLHDTLTEAVTETFTAHTPEIGGSWVNVTGFATAANVIGGAGYVTSTSSSTAIFRNTAEPGSPDYSVEGLCQNTNTLSGFMGVIGRCSATASEFYMWYYEGSGGGIYRLERYIGGVTTPLGTYTASLAINTDALLTLRMEGTSLKGLVDGVERVSVTDDVITSAGFAGIRTKNTGKIFEITGQLLGSGPADAIVSGGTGTGIGSGSGGDATGASSGDVTVAGGTGTGTGSGSGGDASGETVATGTFVVGPLENSPGFQWLNQAVAWTWTPSGRVGSMAGLSPVDGTGTTDATTGELTVTGLAAGAGKLDVSVLGATPEDDIVYTQYGTVT